MSRNPSSRRTTEQDPGRDVPLANPAAIVVAAWLMPGLGHFLLGRRARGIGFAILLIGSVLFGASLHGRAPWIFAGPPLLILATFGAMGSGLPFMALHFGGYEGDPTSWSWEYGGAFILTAGLMNLLLILDAWDVCWGRERIPAEGEPADDAADAADVADTVDTSEEPAGDPA